MKCRASVVAWWVFLCLVAGCDDEEVTGDAGSEQDADPDGIDALGDTDSTLDEVGDAPTDTASDGNDGAADLPRIDSTPDAGPPMEGLFTDAITEVTIEVDYQEGAEPYTGPMLPAGDTWDLFITNAEALFAESPKTLTVPTDLDDMEALDDITRTDFTVSDILDIAEAHRDLQDTTTTRTFYVVFLDGYFFRDGERRSTVLGVSIGNTGVIAMFKPVIGTDGLLVTRFVEQTTLIHEFGHAVGLVNNGVPMVADHQDTEHGAHCTNTECVMYYLNEGAEDMIDFVGRRVLTPNSVVFDDDCLDDVAAAAGE